MGRPSVREVQTILTSNNGLHMSKKRDSCSLSLPRAANHYPSIENIHLESSSLSEHPRILSFDLDNSMEAKGEKSDAVIYDTTDSQTTSAEDELRIRRLLTLYLASLVTFADDRPSHFQLCHPETALEVKEIPEQVTGLRRQYLKEIQANIKARQKYQDFLTLKKSERVSVPGIGENGKGARRLETHLKLLQMRKRHEEVRIMRHYLEALKETNPAKDGALDFRSGQVHGDELPPLASVGGANGAGYQGESTKALTEKLERAVIRAKDQLEREKALLAEVKARHATDSLQDGVIDPKARVAALCAAKDELVRFLEEKMSCASLEDEDVPARVTEQCNEPRSSQEEVEEQIKAEYEAYVTARKRVLEAAANALYTSPEPDPGTAAVSDKSTRAAENRARPPPATGQSAVSTLPFISEQILPLVQNQKATTLQKSYTAKVVKTQRAKAVGSLERLADESHLLPAYPIMARQERYKNVAAALGGPGKLGQAMSEPGQGDELVRSAEAWTFAAEEAKKAEEDFVRERIKCGNEMLDGAKESLAVLDQLLGGDKEQSELDGDDGGEADIWLKAAGADTQNARSRRMRPSQQEQGPWAGLNGRIGVLDGNKS